MHLLMCTQTNRHTLQLALCGGGGGGGGGGGDGIHTYKLTATRAPRLLALLFSLATSVESTRAVVNR